MKILYTAEATASGGREGRVRSSDGVLDLQLAVPKSMGGPGGDFTNPEQLFASAYAACFQSALKVAARRSHVDVDRSTVTARVGIGPHGPGYGLEAELLADLPGLERPVAEDLMAQAHQICPYSNATRGNISVTLNVLAGEG